MIEQDIPSAPSSDEPSVLSPDTDAIAVEQSHEAIIATLTEQLAQEKDKALRAWAELDNYKRRKDAEFDLAKRYAIEQFVVSLLPLMDNFDRALGSVAEGADDGVTNGIQMIRKQLADSLEKAGVSSFESLGCQLDTNRHMAVSTESREGVAPNEVIQVFQEGYTMHGKVIRPAMVVVSS